MAYPDYLVHFNRNHDKKTGKFTYGDGDGDGINNDHANQKKETLGEKAKKAVDSYDRAVASGRARSIKGEQYKVTRDELRKKQAQISDDTTSAKVNEKMSKLALQREKQDTKNYIRSQRLEAQKEARALRAEKAAQRFENQMRKNQLRAERAEQRQMLSEERQYQRAERRARKEARSYQRRVANYNTASQKKGRDAITALFTGRPVTAIIRGASAMSYSNKAKDLVNYYSNFSA